MKFTDWNAGVTKLDLWYTLDHIKKANLTPRLSGWTRESNWL